MMQPTILIQGKFKPQDLIISVSESTRKIDPTIEAKLEPIWIAMLKRAEEKGQTCYNGISYRLNSIQETEDKILIDFGTIEYKVRDGLIAIPEYFDLPEEYFRKGCFSSASIRTSDNRYLMVELTGKSMNQNNIDMIGGIMETNVDMKTGADIFKSLYVELEEEAGITEADIQEAYLQTVYVEYRTNVAFYFEVILNIPSTEILKRFESNKDTDIKSLAVFTREEYITALQNHKSINKHLTAKLLKI
jgi:hypothetical protein